MLLRRARGNNEGNTRKIGEWEKSGKERRWDGTVGSETARGNWKFLLPLRFHFMPNHATMAGFIQRILTRFATETSLQVNTLNDAVGDRK